MHRITRILGIDPGLNFTGWGVVEAEGSSLRFVACGRIAPRNTLPMAERLRTIAAELTACITAHAPDEAAVEETFVNRNPLSALKLGMARGIAMLAPAQAGLPVAEYAANLVKKTVSGYGHADKAQVLHMVKLLLPLAQVESPDAADALAIALCHAQHRQSTTLLQAAR